MKNKDEIIIKLTITTLVVIVCAFSASAQKTQDKWDLRGCIDYAIENNIEVKTRALSVMEAETELNTAKNSRLPDFNVGTSQGFNFGQAPVRRFDEVNNVWYDAYENTQTATSNFSASSSIVLFAGGQITNEIKTKQSNLQALYEELAAVKENLELQVTSAYLEVLLNKELVSVYAHQTELTHKMVESTQMLVEAGRVAESQYYDILSQAANDESSLVIARNNHVQSLVNLAHLLNITDTRNFDIVEPAWTDYLPEGDILKYSPESLWESAADTRPGIIAAQRQVETSQFALKFAKSTLFPTLTLAMGYNNYYYYDFSAGRINPGFQSQLRLQGSESVVLNLSIPIFNKFSQRNRIRIARLAVTRMELALENVKLNFAKDINHAYISAIGAQAKYDASKRAVEAAQIAFNHLQNRYQVGKATVTELNESQTKLIISKSEQLQAKYEFIFRTKILDFYRGKPLSL